MSATCTEVVNFSLHESEAEFFERELASFVPDQVFDAPGSPVGRRGLGATGRKFDEVT